MKIKNYLEEIKEFQVNVIEYLDNEFENRILINYLQDQFRTKEKPRIKEILELIINIINNHHRSPNFWEKTDELLYSCKDSINQIFSNYEIFNLFKINKRILYFLIKESMIEIDETIFKEINDSEYWNDRYIQYFLIESKPFISNKLYKEIKEGLKSDDLKTFEENRKKGENDSFICHLIRNDLIEEFVTHVSRNNINLSSTIKQSIFETNSFLLNKNVSLIEYAAFFGSIQIFQYLKFNQVEMNPSLWLYAIHGRNPELIHLIEENQIKPADDNYQVCFEESIKCYSNDIAIYIQDNYLNNDDFTYLYFKYRNYAFLNSNLCDPYIVFLLSEFNYVFLLDKILHTYRINININEKIAKRDHKTSLQIAFDNSNYDIVKILMSYNGAIIRSNTLGKNSNLNELVIPPSVALIEASAFKECTSLTKVTIPSSITEIKEETFSKCTSLIEVIIPSSVTKIGDGSFFECTKLSIINIQSVESIGKMAFKKCTSLVNVELNSTITLIEDGAFSECESLKQITFPSSVKSIGNESFSGCISLEKITIHSELYSIGNFAFCKCSKLSNFSIPSSVTLIGNNSFELCSSLSDIKLPSSLKKLGEYTFKKCTSLKKVTLNTSIQNTGIGTFFECFLLESSLITDICHLPYLNMLKEIYIPESIISIDDFAFKKCLSIEKVVIPKNVVSIGNSSFEGCVSLVEINIPNSIRKIGSSAFENCSSLIEVRFPDTVTEIGEYAFFECTALQGVNIPYDLVAIQPYTFYGCISLPRITIGNSHSLESIGRSAFEGCKSLIYFVVLYGSLKSIGSYAFRGCANDMYYYIPETIELGECPFPKDKKIVKKQKKNDDNHNSSCLIS